MRIFEIDKSSLILTTYGPFVRQSAAVADRIGGRALDERGAAGERGYNPRVIALALVLLLQFPIDQQPTTGRVAATITTLEGKVHMPNVQVELRRAGDPSVIAKTVTDGSGNVAFPDVPAGRYTVTAVHPGFLAKDSPAFDVKAGEVARVLLDMTLTFTPPAVEVREGAAAATDSLQPVSISDMVSGSVLELAPLPGDDFRSLLPLLPGVVRGPDGRLRVKGGNPTQGAVQISSTSLNDPSSGDFNVEIPGQSIESVEVLANPFSAEYGRFSTSITQIRTKRATDRWEIKPGNLVPRITKSFEIRAWEPQFSIRGPLVGDRLSLSQDFQFRHVTNSVNTPTEQPDMRVRSFDSFTRLDAILSTRHLIGAKVVSFPREISRATMNTFRPADTTQSLKQSGLAASISDRFAITNDVILDTTVAGRWFEIESNGRGDSPMVYQPQGQSGSFYNDQEREVATLQVVETLSFTANWRGQHVLKTGFDLQRSHFDGFSFSRPVEVRRLDGSLTERTVFSGRTEQQISGYELAIFAQDRWRVGTRVTLEGGLRVDRDVVTERVNWSPRAGAAVAVLPEGRAIIRGGYGRFVQRTPLNVEAFPTYEAREVTRYAPDGSLEGPAQIYTNRLDPELRTPRAHVGNVEWNQRFGRRFLMKFAFLNRQGAHEPILQLRPEVSELFLSSDGESRYREFEATTRFIGGERRDLTLSYVWAKNTADLNDYDQFFGNFRNPILRPNENSLLPTDVRHRILLRGTIDLPWQLDFAPVLELRSGFPWTAVDEYQDFVDPRNRTDRLPALHVLDFALSRPWKIKKYNVRLGIKLYNVFGTKTERDVQNNITAPDYGEYYNPLERSVGFVFKLLK